MHFSQRKLKRFSLVLLAALLVPFPLLSTTVLPLNIEELISRADRVFRGACLSTEEVGERGNRPSTRYRFSVLESIKGNMEKQITIKLSGGSRGARGDRPAIPGMPTFQPGEEVLLFLTPANKSGFSTPVGLYLGVFRLGPDATGEQQAVNGIDNRDLLTGLDQGRLNQAGITPEEFPWLHQESGPVPLEGFLRVVGRLVQEAEH